MTPRSARAGVSAQGVQSKVRKMARSMITPKTAAEKVIFRRNATESMLLQLPPEIRNRIWGFVLGHQMLHIHREYKGNDWHSRNESVLRARCCTSPFTETELFEETIRKLRELVEIGELKSEPRSVETDIWNDNEAFNLDFSTLENPDVLENFDFDSFLNQSVTESTNYDPDWSFSLAADESIFVTDTSCLVPDTGAASTPWERRKMLKDALRQDPHIACTTVLPGTANCTPRKGFNLQLLRTCRQVYAEASAIMWTTNTFSFSGPDDFLRFIADRPSFTRAMVTKLRFDVNSLECVLHDWKRTLQRSASIHLLAELKSLKVLYCHLALWSGTYMPSVSKNFLEAFEKFRLMPLQDVTLTFTDAIRWSSQEYSWTDEDRISFVKKLRRDLHSAPPST